MDEPRRLQRMTFRLQRYTFSWYLSLGRTCCLPTLSLERQCHSLTHPQREFETVCMVVNAQLADPILQGIRRETKADKTLQTVMQYVAEGWPDAKSKVPAGGDVGPFHSFREEIVCSDGLLFKRDRCVIPSTKCRVILTQRHSTHLGLKSTLRRVRDTVF